VKNTTLEHDIAELVEEFLRKAGNRRELGDAGIGDENVDQAAASASLCEQALKVGNPANITPNRYGILAQIVRGLIECRAIAPKDDDSGAVGPEFAGRC
jgi:hypothetical protein